MKQLWRAWWERLTLRLNGEFSRVEREAEVARRWARFIPLLGLAGLLLRVEMAVRGALVLLGLLALSWLWDRLSLVRLSYRRHFSEERAFLGEEVTLTLTLRNAKPLPLLLEIEDAFPGELPIAGCEQAFNPLTQIYELRSFWLPGPFQRLERHFRIRCTQRGYHAFGPAALTTGDALGLFTTRAQLPQRDRLIIYPKVYPVWAAPLPGKQPLGDWISHQTLFEDPLRVAGVRDWQAGDGWRRVHWKATARYQRLLSRVYEPSEEAQVMFFLNTATLEQYWAGCVHELFERVVSVTASLVLDCSTRRLPVGLAANAYWPGSDQWLRLAPGRSPDQVMRLLEMLAVVQGLPVVPIEELLLMQAARLPWGATLVLVTGLTYPALLSALEDLARSGRKVALVTLAEPPAVLVDVRIYHAHLLEDTLALEEVG